MRSEVGVVVIDVQIPAAAIGVDVDAPGLHFSAPFSRPMKRLLRERHDCGSQTGADHVSYILILHTQPSAASIQMAWEDGRGKVCFRSVPACVVMLDAEANVMTFLFEARSMALSMLTRTLAGSRRI